MSDVLASEVEIVEEASQFFAPTQFTVIDSLLAQYRGQRLKIERLSELMTAGEFADVFVHFGVGPDARTGAREAKVDVAYFDAEVAIASLNATYWSRAMDMTDVLECMPHNRRAEWQESIRHHKTPDFSEESVRPTLELLLTQREKFFAERVDGVFRALSGTHVTNAPEAFGKRMIIDRILDRYGDPESGRYGYIDDLRVVIAKFMGRDAPCHGASRAAILHARRHSGEWVSLDGGALRLRVYKVGTAHLEVHPDMAWRLNQVLSSLYPAAIPAQFRSRPAKRSKSYSLIGRPLPFTVIKALMDFMPYRRLAANSSWHNERYETVKGEYTLHNLSSLDKRCLQEVGTALEAIGGTSVGYARWAFDYNPEDVVKELVVSGVLPDQKAFQFYPTRERLATIAAGLADIGEEDECLEPSAGTGGLADFMPKQRTLCVEIGDMQCGVLKAKGHRVVQADFLQWATACSSRFPRIVMNPPFSDGRWQEHVKAASGLLASGGRLVAILPASARGSLEMPEGFECTWHGPYDNEFPGTSVSVVILVADKKAA